MDPRVWRAVVVAAALAGCGGGSHPAATPPARPAAAGATAAAASGEVAVIGGWARALAHGDVGAAAAYFATPSRVQIAPGEPTATVRTPADARAVNLALPCGAKLLGTRRIGGYIDALFGLMRRPGADCGSGVGGTARVAFVIRAGRIAVWRRIADEPGDAAHAAPGFRPGAPSVPLPPAARPV
jgi:hypothetical protein